MEHLLLQVNGLTCLKEKGQPILSNVTLTVNDGDIVVLRGKSGCGKTTLLKCLAHLNVYDGQILYRGKPPKFIGIPSYRTRVLYVPQRPSLLPGTPHDFLQVISSFSARKAQLGPKEGGILDLERPIGIASSWGVETQLWDRNWSNLSGGESQRIALASAIGLNTAEIILLDEPTSALDAESSLLVENFLMGEVRAAGSTLKAVVWITHSEEQASRVGTRFINISSGGCFENPLPVV